MPEAWPGPSVHNREGPSVTERVPEPRALSQAAIISASSAASAATADDVNAWWLNAAIDRGTTPPSGEQRVMTVPSGRKARLPWHHGQGQTLSPDQAASRTGISSLKPAVRSPFQPPAPRPRRLRPPRRAPDCNQPAPERASRAVRRGPASSTVSREERARPDEGPVFEARDQARPRRSFARGAILTSHFPRRLQRTARQTGQSVLPLMFGNWSSVLHRPR